MTSADLIASFKKQPIGFVCGVICVICAGLIYYTTSQIEETEAESQTKSAEAAKILTNVRNSAKLAEQVTEIQAFAKELDGRLVRAGQLAVNQQFFYKLEAETGVKMSDVNQSGLGRNAKGQSLFAAIPFNVTVTGSFPQLLAFLQRLESGAHYCRFNSVTFSKGGGSTETGRSSGGADLSNMTLALNIELLGTP